MMIYVNSNYFYYYYIYNSINKKYFVKKKSEIFRPMCTRTKIIITIMIFLFCLNNRQPTYAIPVFSQHKTILLKNDNNRPHFNLA